ncbi:MAG: hypothetical protein OXM55_07030 [Bdellovibrionales bacterium]|nr:hypothetical protein [Bdellovibrionales bacterium]
MKYLILLLSFVLALSSGCGGGEHHSTEDLNDGALAGSPTDDGSSSQPGSSLTDDPPIPSTPQTPNNLCTKTCVTDAECGEKYNTCLKPHAGEPTKTYTDICTNSQASKVTLVVNEWDAPSGQNKLLCDFIENDRILYKFATVQKEACRKDMEVRKMELAQEGYSCGTPAPISIQPAVSAPTETITADTERLAPPGRSAATTVRHMGETSPLPTSSPPITTRAEGDLSAEKIEETDICDRPCGDTVQCRAKHKNCLRPKVGDPVTTEEIVCTKAGEKNISFKLNEWDSSGQGKTLLCDLIEDGELLRFATVQKNNCQLRLKERQAELINEGYDCQPQ